MKKICMILAVASALSFAMQADAKNVKDVVPYPNKVHVGEGNLCVKGAKVTYDASMDAATVNVVKNFAQTLTQVTGQGPRSVRVRQSPVLYL